MPPRKRQARPENQRASIADEAARLIMERGLTDYRAAKAKACERLGLARGPLPSNGEVEQALAARNRLFRGDRHTSHLRRLREVAVDVMLRLESFHPRLVGPVLSGNATEHAAIDLHLYSDTPEAVGMQLEALALSHKAILFRHRWRPGEAEPVPGYRFFSDEFECLATVFPVRRRAQPPLSPVDGKPMRRASHREVTRLIGDELAFSAG